MSNLVSRSPVTAAIPARKRLILLSPIAVVLLGQFAARTLGPVIGIWSWLPLTVGYWIVLLLLIVYLGKPESIHRWLRPSQGHWFWPLMAILIATVPTVPMLFPDAWRLFLQAQIYLPTILFVLINPCAEEGYWRGLLLDAVKNNHKGLGILYSSCLFMINHMWISVAVFLNLYSPAAPW